MNSIKKWNTTLSFILVIASFCFAGSLSAAKTAPKSVWSKSYSYEGLKKYADAANVLEPLLQSDPNNEFLLLRLGWLNYLQTKYNVSFSFYKKALALNSSSIDARLGLTLPLLAQLRWKEAAVYAREVIDMSAWDLTAHTRLMTSESALQQWAVLESHAFEVVKHYPSDLSAIIFLARAQAMQGKKSQANVNYTLALQRSPENLEAINYLK